MRKKRGEQKPIVSLGFLRVGDDFDSDLRVKVVVVDGQLSMMTDSVEIGVWPNSAVLVEQTAEDRFTFTVDGESLAFFPDHPREFLEHGIGTRPNKRARKRARSAPKPVTPVAPATNGEVTDEFRVDPETNGHHTEGLDRVPDDRPVELAPPLMETMPIEPGPPSAPEIAAEAVVAKAATREQRVAAKAARSEQRAGARARRAEERELARERREKGRATRREIRANKEHPVREKMGASARSAQEAAAGRGTELAQRAGWRARLGVYWAMDELRQIDGWPFNRIPHIDPDKRKEPGHEHTFQRTPAPAGIIREVCACGKIQLTSVPIELEGPAHLRQARAEREIAD